MTFNVENLFDTEHDAGKDDYTFLPLARKNQPDVQKSCGEIKVRKWRNECLYKDWSEPLVHEKLSRLARTILSVGDGRGPDILLLQEVENHKILERLRTEFLADAHYLPGILLEGPDSRGIDVAVLSRLPVIGEPILHTVEMGKTSKETRGVLDVHLLLPDGTPVLVFVVHLPSGANPGSDRDQVFSLIEELRESAGPDRLIIAGGDFNTTKAEDQRTGRFKELAEHWLVSHLVGCRHCLGTHYYHAKREWSFFDVLLFSKKFAERNSPWRLNPASVEVVKNNPQQINRYGAPASIEDASDPIGVSDHFPLIATIEM